MFFKSVYIFVVIMFLAQTAEGIHREKRHLIFYQGGGFKLVIGIAIPIKLGIKQSVACGVNFQFQYAEATNITQLEKPYPPIITRSSRETKTTCIQRDRTLFYLGVESVLSKYGMDGRECLLRAICENAMYPIRHDANGLYGEFLHLLLTPLYGTGDCGADPIYSDAQRAGEFGVDCVSLYPECSWDGGSVMDTMSVLDN